VIELPLRYQTVSNLFLWNLSMEQMQPWRVWLFYLWREWKTEVLLPSCLGVRVESHVWSSLMNNPVHFSLSKSNTWSTPWRMLFVNGNCWSQNYCEIRLRSLAYTIVVFLKIQPWLCSCLIIKIVVLYIYINTNHDCVFFSMWFSRQNTNWFSETLKHYYMVKLSWIVANWTYKSYH